MSVMKNDSYKNYLFLPYSDITLLHVYFDEMQGFHPENGKDSITYLRGFM